VRPRPSRQAQRGLPRTTATDHRPAGCICQTSACTETRLTGLLAFLQLRPFNECPEYDFAECFSGVPGTVGYVSFNKYSVEHIAEMLIKKLKA